jgi:hypothetical protein
MIEKWVSACSKHKCNYLVEEYPEFAVKGGYQHAINFKPYFINLALKACYPRGVLYIDGDMIIKKYPGIFDTKEVDYMARGWNTDPRVAPWGEPCFDPYTFETSGGTMFFGNTYYGRSLLDFWEKAVLKYPGKADDRVLAFTIMKEHLLTRLSTIQVPMEYLWMTLDYDNIFKKYPNDVNKNGISITHPECLTGEDRASAEGAASNRYPRAYDRYVSDFLYCEWDEIYEYLQFEDKSQVAPFKPYFNFLDEHGVVDLYTFAKKYGPFNTIAKKNTELLEKIELKVRDKLVLVSPHEFLSVSLHKVSSEHEALLTVLKYLLNGQAVLYSPGKSTRSFKTVISKAVNDELDFVARNNSKRKDRAKSEYSLDVDKEYPMFFGPNNRVLKQWLLMSMSISEMEKLFNRTYIFLTRIHCGWV